MEIVLIQVFFLTLVLNKNNNNEHAKYHAIFIPFKGEITCSHICAEYFKNGVYLKNVAINQKVIESLKCQTTRFRTESKIQGNGA